VHQYTQPFAVKRQRIPLLAILLVKSVLSVLEKPDGFAKAER
jgi:hypothetical protein